MSEPEEKKDEKDIITEDDILHEANNALINVLVGGQTVQIGTRKIERANLNGIKELREEMINQINNNSSSDLFPNTYIGIFSGR